MGLVEACVLVVMQEDEEEGGKEGRASRDARTGFIVGDSLRFAS